MTTAAKLRKAEGRVSSLAKKVLEAIPFNTSVDHHGLVVAARSCGISNKPAQIIAAAHQLVDVGLAREPKPHQLIRVKASVALANGLAPIAPIKVESIAEDYPMTTRRVIGASSAEANVSEEQPPRDPMDVIIEMREQFEAAMYEISRYYELKNAEIERVDRARAAAKSLMEAMEK